MPTIAIAVFIIVVIFIGPSLLVWGTRSFEAARRNTTLSRKWPNASKNLASKQPAFGFFVDDLDFLFARGANPLRPPVHRPVTGRHGQEYPPSITMSEPVM